MHHHDPPTCHLVSTWQNQHGRKRYKTKNYWSKMAEVANQSHRSPATRFFLAGDLGTNGCPCCPSRKTIWKATLDWPTVHCHPPRHIPWHPYIWHSQRDPTPALNIEGHVWINSVWIRYVRIFVMSYICARTTQTVSKLNLGPLAHRHGYQVLHWGVDERNGRYIIDILYQGDWHEPPYRTLLTHSAHDLWYCHEYGFAK